MTHCEIIGFITVLLAFAFLIPYLIGTLKGTIKPHPFTWILWTSLTLIIFFAQIFDGAGPGAWSTGTVGVICIAITIFSLKNGFSNIKKTDVYLFSAGILAIPLWLVTNDQTLSVILVTIIDLIAFGPTFRKSYYNPYDEPIYAYTINALRNGLSLFALTNVTIATALFPACVMLANIALSLFLLWRRKIMVKN